MHRRCNSLQNSYIFSASNIEDVRSWYSEERNGVRTAWEPKGTVLASVLKNEVVGICIGRKVNTYLSDPLQTFHRVRGPPTNASLHLSFSIPLSMQSFALQGQTRYGVKNTSKIALVLRKWECFARRAITHFPSGLAKLRFARLKFFYPVYQLSRRFILVECVLITPPCKALPLAQH